MNTTLTRRRKIKRPRLVGPQEDYCFRLAADDLDAMDDATQRQGVSIAEGMRQAVKLFLAVNMNMLHGHDTNGHVDADR